MPPQLLQVFRERVKLGSEAEYETLETETCRLCAELGCPHPFLGAESLTGPKEVWFFNGYDSHTEYQEVVAAYTKNTRLLTAIMKNSQRKAALTEAPVETFATYRPELSRGASWRLGIGRFLVILVTSDQRDSPGTVFEAADGARFIVTFADTRPEADRAAASAGPEAVICAVQPHWSFPDPDWVARDADLWSRAG